MSVDLFFRFSFFVFLFASLPALLFFSFHYDCLRECGRGRRKAAVAARVGYIEAKGRAGEVSGENAILHRRQGETVNLREEGGRGVGK